MFQPFSNSGVEIPITAHNETVLILWYPEMHSRPCSAPRLATYEDSPGHIARKLTFQPTTPPDFRNSTPPAAPRDPCSSPDNIRLPDIIYVYILSRCSRSRHHSFLFLFFGFWFFLVFCFFWFVVAYCTQLPSQAMYNLMMATTMAETCSC